MSLALQIIDIYLSWLLISVLNFKANILKSLPCITFAYARDAIINIDREYLLQIVQHK